MSRRDVWRRKTYYSNQDWVMLILVDRFVGLFLDRLEWILTWRKIFTSISLISMGYFLNLLPIASDPHHCRVSSTSTIFKWIRSLILIGLSVKVIPWRRRRNGMERNFDYIPLSKDVCRTAFEALFSSLMFCPNIVGWKCNGDVVKSLLVVAPWAILFSREKI